MPTYEYRCKECGHELEAFQKITEAALKTCPQCNKDTLERLISGGNFVLKGGGWYKEGYQRSKDHVPGRSENVVADKIASKQAEASKKKASSDAA